MDRDVHAEEFFALSNSAAEVSPNNQIEYRQPSIAWFMHQKASVKARLDHPEGVIKAGIAADVTLRPS